MSAIGTSNATNQEPCIEQDKFFAILLEATIGIADEFTVVSQSEHPKDYELMHSVLFPLVTLLLTTANQNTTILTKKKIEQVINDVKEKNKPYGVDDVESIEHFFKKEVCVKHNILFLNQPATGISHKTALSSLFNCLEKVREIKGEFSDDEWNGIIPLAIEGSLCEIWFDYAAQTKLLNQDNIVAVDEIFFLEVLRMLNDAYWQTSNRPNDKDYADFIFPEMNKVGIRFKNEPRENLYSIHWNHQ